MTMQTMTYAGSAVGEGMARNFLTSLAQRAGFALGLVLAVALLGALAFTTRTDVQVVWFDERGHAAIGIKRTDTQERLDQTVRELAEARRQLDAEGTRTAVAARGGHPEITKHGEAAWASEQRAREAERATERAQKAVAEHAASITTLRRQNASLETQLHAQKSALTVAVGERDREINRLKDQMRATPNMIEYRPALAADEGYLPLRARPERGARILKAIPANAGGVLSTCKLAVADDAVFVEASYEGVTGWVSGFYLVSGP